VLGPVKVVPPWTEPALRRNMAAIGKHGQARSANSKCPRFQGNPAWPAATGRLGTSSAALRGLVPESAGPYHVGATCQTEGQLRSLATCGGPLARRLGKHVADAPGES
jgi:hypothetical protein